MTEAHVDEYQVTHTCTLTGDSLHLSKLSPDQSNILHFATKQGKGYLNRSDVEFMKMALRGITIIIADGDTGAGDLVCGLLGA